VRGESWSFCAFYGGQNGYRKMVIGSLLIAAGALVLGVLPLVAFRSK
jgi:hypothetical protein